MPHARTYTNPSTLKHYAIINMKKVIKAILTLMARTRDAIALAPRLVRKPFVLCHWLLSARWAQLVLVLVVLTMPSLVPSAVDVQLEKLYPPITTKKILGLIKYTKPDPRLKDRQKLVRIVLWTGSGSLVLYLLLLHIPDAINRAHALARKHESEADALAESQPSASVLHYNSAISLVSDPRYEVDLKSKLRALDKRLIEISEHRYGVSAKPEYATESARTVKMEIDAEQPSGEERGKTIQTILIEGPDGVGPGGRYCIRQELGRGAMGIVYRAHDCVLARDVAIKQIPVYLSHDHQLIARFRQEARALARLCHPHIVQVYDFVQDGEQAWITMELVEGEELEKSLRESGPVSIGEAMEIGGQLAEALAYAHERGVIHRDFKPANVLLTQHRSVKITDFGLAKLAHSSIYTQEGSVLGSPAYMSPEQAAGRGLDARSDIYALGVTLFKMLTGRLPFEGDAESVIAQKLTKGPPPLSALNEQIPEQLSCLVLQMLAKEPNKRPLSMDTVAEALRTSFKWG
ncbi:MAG: serine/threonine-protein kinase [bacterium]